MNMRSFKIVSIFIFCLVMKLTAQTHFVVDSNTDPTNPLNPPPGTLRWAIEQANANPGLDYIDFSISMTPPIVIQLQSNLPPISDVVIIDGNTQPANGTSGVTHKIAIKGDTTTGIISYIFSLYKNYPWESVIADASSSEIRNLKIYESDDYGIFLSRVEKVKIIHNILHSVNHYGIRFSGASKSVVQGNIIGTDNTFNLNSYYSVKDGNLINADNNFQGDSNLIGGLNAGEPNYFYNANQPVNYYTTPIRVGGNYNRISGNVFINNSRNINLDQGKGCYGNYCHQPPTYQAVYSSGSTLVNGSSANKDFIELFKTNSGGVDALQFLGSVAANSSGQWNINLASLTAGDTLIATATDTLGNTSEFSSAIVVVTSTTSPCCSNFNFNLKSETSAENICAGDSFYIYVSCPQLNYTWNFGNGTILNTTGTNHVVYAYPLSGTYSVIVTANPTNNNCTASSDTIVITIGDCRPPCVPSFIFEGYHPTACANQEICYVSHPRICTAQNQQNFIWNFGDGSPTVTGCSWCHTFSTPGTYSLSVTVSDSSCIANTVTAIMTVDSCLPPPPPPPCIDCIGSFAPIPTKKYIISAWVKEGNAPLTKTSYTYPNVVVQCPSASFTSPSFLPTGAIIDGWQRIEGEFTIPATASDISIELNCTSPGGDCYFDDIRVFPMDGSMKSYVYDPVTMRLMAELDERNYATLYEYDEEGKLIRVKKETEKGIMTIKESRDNSSK
ncbi:MAG: hypothetical protein K0S53_1685 [Bacteroidetes bacterium]|jgi:hypothetical protein|nr:hypothetical protein [Bacteroidota bacterium]MDF2450524.1 hypothetical protein [Bacteroidota bacterium]